MKCFCALHTKLKQHQNQCILMISITQRGLNFLYVFYLVLSGFDHLKVCMNCDSGTYWASTLFSWHFCSGLKDNWQLHDLYSSLSCQEFQLHLVLCNKYIKCELECRKLSVIEIFRINVLWMIFTTRTEHDILHVDWNCQNYTQRNWYYTDSVTCRNFNIYYHSVLTKKYKTNEERGPFQK